MQTITFNEFCYTGPFVIFNIFNYTFFIKNNFFNTNIKTTSKDVLVKKNHLKKSSTNNYALHGFINLLLTFVSITFYAGHPITNFFNHLRFNNFTTTLPSLIIILTSSLLIYSTFINKSVNNKNVDYVFSIGLLSCLLPTIYLANTIYTLFFLIEVNSSLVFYKFVTSNFWFKNLNNNLTKSTLKRELPKNYLNTLFFQYWVTFFSSSLLLYSLANIIMLYGSTDFAFIEFIQSSNRHLNYNTDYYIITIIWFSFITGFLLKVGITPIHLFKLEIYRGLPYLSIFFYTTVYFVSFFILFLLLLSSTLTSIFNSIWYVYFLIIIFGGIYTCFLMFNATFVKSFFGYSTVINSYILFFTFLGTFF